MKFTRVYIENFKSFDRQELHLEDFTLLLGANAAGKSNIISIFRFIDNVVNYGIQDALSLMGGIDHVINAGLGKKQPLILEFSLNVQDEHLQRQVNPKDSRSLLFLSIDYRCALKAYARTDSYRIVEDRISLNYRCLSDNSETAVSKGNLTVQFSRKGNRIIPRLTAPEGFRDAAVRDSFALTFQAGILSRNPRELILNKLDYLAPFVSLRRHFIKIYNFDPTLLKQASSVISMHELAEDGSNIAFVLEYLLRSPSNKRMLTNLLAHCLPFIKDIGIQQNLDRSKTFKIQEVYQDRVFRSDFLSDGTVNILALIVALYFQQYSGIVIIEEPERNLHPKLISSVAEMAKDAAVNKQVLITTHSQEFVKHTELSSLLFVQRSDEGFTQTSKPADNETVRAFLQSALGAEDLFLQDLLGN
ncbi:MAG: AAA family ATPase [Christensenellales bacterium]|jgi:predicted ATPase